MDDNNINNKKEKKNLSPSQLLEKYKFFYLVHGKAISEFSPDLNILLRKFLIKKIYDLSQSTLEIKQKSEDFLNSICGLEKAKEISLNFNADKLCKYEDFITFIEKSFEAAEEDFNDKIIQNDYSNYLQLIAVYRLISDMTDLIDCWKEKDENIQKFQTLCKYRCIQIISAKNDFETKPKTGIEKEIEQLSNDIKNEKNEPVEFKTDSQICNELLGNNNYTNYNINYNTNINNNNNNINFNKQSISSSVLINRNVSNQNQSGNKDDFNLIKKLTLFVADGNNNYKSIMPKVNNYNLNNQNIKKLENKDNNNDNSDNNSKTGKVLGTNYIDNKVNNPYSKLTNSLMKAIKNEQQEININANYSQLNSNIQNPYEQFNNNNSNNNNINNNNNNINNNNNNINNNNNNNNQNQQNNNLFNNEFGNFNKQQEFGGFNNYNNQNQPKIDPKLIEYQKQVQQQYNNNYSYRYVPPKPKTQSILPQRKIIVKKKDKEELEIEKMLAELKGNPQKNISNNNQRKTSYNINNNNNNNNNNNKVNINSPNKKVENSNKKKENVIISNPLIVPTEFKQQTTNLLNNFKYKKEKKLDIELPVVYRDVDYIYLLSHIKQEMIPDIIDLIEKNNLEKALSQSEMILYYLTNIIPKE